MIYPTDLINIVTEPLTGSGVLSYQSLRILEVLSALLLKALDPYLVENAG